METLATVKINKRWLVSNAVLYNFFRKGITAENVSDVVGFAITEYLSYIASTEGLAGLASVLGTKATIAMGVGVIIAEGYIFGNSLIEITNTINTQYGSYNYMMDTWWNGF